LVDSGAEQSEAFRRRSRRKVLATTSSPVFRLVLIHIFLNYFVTFLKGIEWGK
jgi:hypothetical protein